MMPDYIMREDAIALIKEQTEEKPKDDMDIGWNAGLSCAIGQLETIPKANEGGKLMELKHCPFCRGKDVVTISVCDDEGNYHGELGCEYEQDPWSGLSYALAHEGWGRCILCTNNEPMGGILFDTAEDAAEAWNRRTDDV